MLFEFNVLFIIENIFFFCIKIENVIVLKNVNYVKLFIFWVIMFKGCEGFWVSMVFIVWGVIWENSGEDKIVNIL